MSYYTPMSGEVEAFAREYGNGETKRNGNQIAFKHCPFCHGSGQGNEYTFIINVTTGQYECKRASCGQKGNLATLAHYFNFELQDEDYKRRIAEAKRREDIKRKRQLVSTMPKMESTPRAIEYLTSRGISKEVCEKYEITSTSKNEDIIAFLFRSADDNSVKYIKYRNTRFVKGKTEGSKEWAESGLEAILFGMNHCNTDDTRLVITEGQIDSLSVATAMPDVNVVSVPNGCNGETWVSPCKPFMSYFGEIIVFGDYERKTKTVTLVDMIKRNFKATIKQVREEDYPGDTKDANEILQQYGAEQIRKCIENAKIVQSDEIIDITKVRPTNEENIQHIQTGIYEIDRCLRGGIPCGGTTIVTGYTGAGKTTLINQIIANAINENYKCFIYSGEFTTYDTKMSLYMNLAGKSVKTIGKNPFGDLEFGLDDETLTKIDKWVEGKCFIRNQEAAFALMLGESEQERLSEKITRSARQYGCKVVVIDNLMTAMDEEQIKSESIYATQSQFTKRMTALARNLNLFMIIVAHHNKNSSSDLSSVSGSADIVNLASVVLDYGKLKDENGRSLAITKNRLKGGKLNSGVRIDFEESSCRIWGEGDRGYYMKDKTFDWLTYNPNSNLDTILF